MAGLANHPAGYAPIEASEGADVGQLGLDSMLLGADADVQVVSLYSDSEQVGADSDSHSGLLSDCASISLHHYCSTTRVLCQPLFQDFFAPDREKFFLAEKPGVSEFMQKRAGPVVAGAQTKISLLGLLSNFSD